MFERICRSVVGVSACAILCSTFACTPPVKPGPAPETNAGRAEWGRGTDAKGTLKPGIDFAVVQYVTWQDRVAFALWTDLGGIPDSFPNELSSYLRPNNAGSEGRYSGSIQEKKVPGPVIEFQCVTTDGVTGSVRVAGKAFDLADGFLLLVSTAEGKIRSKQLKREPLTVASAGRPQDVLKALENLKADSEVVSFFNR